MSLKALMLYRPSKLSRAYVSHTFLAIRFLRHLSIIYIDDIGKLMPASGNHPWTTQMMPFFSSQCSIHPYNGKLYHNNKRQGSKQCSRKGRESINRKMTFFLGASLQFLFKSSSFKWRNNSFLYVAFCLRWVKTS